MGSLKSLSKIDLNHLRAHLTQQLHITSIEDWYRVSGSDLIQHGAQKLLNKHSGSPSATIRALFPSHKWLHWMFPMSAKGYWNNKSHQVEFMEWLGSTLGFTTMEHWYKVKASDFIIHGAAPFIQKFGCSPCMLLSQVYPNHAWEKWRFSCMKGWSDPANQEAFMQHVAKVKGYKTFQDWYSITSRDIADLGGSGLWNIFGNSPSRIVMSIYNQHNWEPWQFNLTPVGFWSDIRNQHMYIEWLGNRLHFSTPEDWYQARREHFVKNGGSALIKMYNFSIPKLVTSLLSNHTWQIWRFKSLPLTYWMDKWNQREYLQWLGKLLGFREFDDWYKISAADFIANYGNTLLKKYKGSPGFLLMSVFSEHPWDSWRFSTRNFGMAEQTPILERFVQKLTSELQVGKLQDWYNVSSQVIQDLGVSGSFLHRNGNLPRILSVVYPQHGWEKEKFSKTLSKKALQKILEISVEKMYEGEEVKVDYFYSELSSNNNGQPLQLDIYVPKHKIAFEFQGVQHYDISLFAGKCFQNNNIPKENSKKNLCAHAGITLVEVPYWWDKTLESLRAIVRSCKIM